MYRRTMGRRRRHVGQFAEEVRQRVDFGDPLHWLLGNERQATVRASALQTLPEIDRQILWLKHTENWTYEQLADRLGVSVRTIEYRLLQAESPAKTREHWSAGGLSMSHLGQNHLDLELDIQRCIDGQMSEGDQHACCDGWSPFRMAGGSSRSLSSRIRSGLNRS